MWKLDLLEETDVHCVTVWRERTIRISTSRRQPHSFSVPSVDSHATVRTRGFKGVRNGSLAACRNEASRPGPAAFRPGSTLVPRVLHMFSRVYSELGGRRGREGGWAWRGVISSAARNEPDRPDLCHLVTDDDDISISKIRMIR